MIWKTTFLFVAAFGLSVAVGSPSVGASDGGKSLVESRCAACHALAEPQQATLEERLTRKGAPLYYAADKYRADWLVQWLQAPTRIWPAGIFYGNHLRSTADGDDIDPATLVEHPVLSAEEARAAADYLMTLSAKADLVAKVDYTPKPISKRMGMLNFGKFKGCSSCHSDEPGYGGVSGPELHTAYNRLQAEFLFSYIQNPQAWEPHSLMPNQHLKEDEVQKLVDYLKVIAEENQ